MKNAARVSMLVALALCFNAAADEVKQSPSGDAPSDVDNTVKALNVSPTQILCVKQQRTGSRIKQNKCLTLAQWRQDINERDMRKSLIRARGKAASWETSP